MKIIFEDKSYLEATKSDDGNIFITIQAKDHQNPLKKITNSVKINKEQLQQLLSDIQ